jgi:hypothetical protein
VEQQRRRPAIAAIISDPGASTPDLMEHPLGRRYLRSWLTTRLVVGLLGLALPVLVIGGDLLLPGGPSLRNSLSAYYYSGLRDVFVGVMCVIGVYLLTYKISERDWDNWLSVVAGVSAVVIALFPTLPEAGDPLSPWQVRLGVTLTGYLHFTAAGVFTVALALVSLRFGHRDAGYGKPRFATTHRICGAIMLAALLALGALKAAGVDELAGVPVLLLAELVSTLAFGVSWLLKGIELGRLLRQAKID